MLRLLIFCLLLSGTTLAEHLPPAKEAAVNPRYLLMDPNGRAVTNEDFPGRFQLITFGYTSCPDVCPLTLLTMANALKQLKADAGRVQGIFITLDPERDKPQQLVTYTTYFSPDIIGLTGSSDLIKRTAQHFRVRYDREYTDKGADNYSVSHTPGMFLLGPDGQYIRKFSYNARPADIAEAIRHVIQMPDSMQATN